MQVDKRQALTCFREKLRSDLQALSASQQDAQSGATHEQARQAQLRRDEMERSIFQTTEGQGIAESASISLGFDDEDEDDLFDFGSGTGLVI